MTLNKYLDTGSRISWMNLLKSRLFLPFKKKVSNRMLYYIKSCSNMGDRVLVKMVYKKWLEINELN